jgi:hypothetical protein
MPVFVYDELGEVTITFLDHDEATATANNHTFTGMTLPTGNCIACFGFLGGSSRAVTSVTIGGVTATQIGSAPGTTRQVAMFIATGVTGPTGDVVITLDGNSSAWACDTFSIVGATSAASTATSVATDPTASMSCDASGAILGVAGAGAASSPSATWTGIAEDSDQNYGTSNLQCLTTAHTNFATAQVGLTVLCDFSTSAASAGLFAAFNPQ